MRFLAVLLFLAFGVLALTSLTESLGGLIRAPWNRRDARPFLAGAWGIGLAWLANLNMWNGWKTGGLRYGWVGVTLTGVALGGTALLAQAILAFFAGLNRKLDDEAEQIERSELRRVS
jgi:hypothetical protein